MSLIILKIGGSVITDKDSVSVAKKDEIDRISKEIAAFKKEIKQALILVHGAGSFGHPHALEHLSKGFNANGVYLTHISVKALNSMVVDSLYKAGLNALPVHPLSSCLLENGNIIEFQIAPIKLMLERDIVPVLHGDVVMDRVLGAAVLSGDRIVPHLAAVTAASGIGAGSNVDGVLDDKGEVIKKITPHSFVDMKKDIMGAKAPDVTGGMLGKVSELVELSKKGINSRVFNAAKKNTVSKFLYGEDVGTLIADK
jgi:isopentenyl phosphate kinase